MKINHAQPNEDGFFYKLMAVIAVAALVVVIILILSTASAKSQPSSGATVPETTAAAAGTTPPSADASPTETAPGAAADTTAASVPDTTAGSAPDTTAAPVASAPLSGTPTEEEMLAHYPGVVLSATEEQGQEYLDKIIFLGDSTTYGLKAYAMLTDGKETKQVWTPTNGTLTLSKANSAKIYYPETKTEMTIVDAVTAAEPQMMVITLGVNGTSFMDETQFKDAYTTLVNAIKSASPDTKIILQSVFPVAKEYDTSGGIDNDKINAANLWVADVAQACSVKYLYTAPTLKDDQGYLVSSYQNGDYVHFNETGYAAELKYIRTHAYQ